MRETTVRVSAGFRSFPGGLGGRPAGDRARPTGQAEEASALARLILCPFAPSLLPSFLPSLGVETSLAHSLLAAFLRPGGLTDLTGSVNFFQLLFMQGE